MTTFLLSNAGKPGGCRGIYSTLPLYTISEELLDRILTRNSVEAEQKERIKKHAVAQRQRVLSILSSETLEDEIPTFRPSDFKERPPVLELSALFYETDIMYSEEEYTAHLRETMAFAEQNMN